MPSRGDEEYEQETEDLINIEHTSKTREHYPTKSNVIVSDAYIRGYRFKHENMNVVTKDNMSHGNSNYSFFSVSLVSIFF
jgi:hypothetical protein